MAASIVQYKVIRQDGGMNSVSATFDSDFTPGNAIIVASVWYGNPANTTSTLASVTDNKGHTFTLRGKMHRDPPADASWAGDMWVHLHDCLNAPDAAPATKITVTLTSANTNNGSRAFAVIMEVSGLDTFSTAATYVSGGLGNDTVVTNLAERPSAPQWAVGVLGILGISSDPVVAPSGWTAIAKHDTSTGTAPYSAGVVAHDDLSTVDAFNTTWFNASAVHGSAAMIASYALTDSVETDPVPVLSNPIAIGVTTDSSTPSVILTYDESGEEPEPSPDPMVPFSADSEWTTPIPPGATFHADERVAMLQMVELGIQHEHWTISVAYAEENDAEEEVEVKYVPGTGDPFTTYTVTLKWPVGTEPNGWDNGEDGHLVVVQPDGTVHDFWHGRWDAVAGRWTFASHMHYPLGTTRGWRIRYEDRWLDGVRPCRAVDVSLLGGLIRAGEITAGVIPHALAMAVPSPMLGRYLPRVYPADPIAGFWDGRSDSTGPIVYSDRFAIPPDVDVNAIARNAGEAIILKAAQDYGVYIVDVTGSGLVGTSSSLYAEYPGAYDEIIDFSLRPSGGMSVLLANLRHVRNWY